MIVLFNIRAAAFLASGVALMIATIEIGASVFVGALVGGAACIALDLGARWRRGRAMLAADAGGTVCLVPVWIVALTAILAAVLVWASLPKDWDRSRSRDEARQVRDR